MTVTGQENKYLGAIVNKAIDRVIYFDMTGYPTFWGTINPEIDFKFPIHGKSLYRKCIIGLRQALVEEERNHIRFPEHYAQDYNTLEEMVEYMSIK